MAADWKSIIGMAQAHQVSLQLVAL